MAKNRNDGLVGYLREHSWAIMLILVGFIITFTTLQTRVSAIEKTVDKYPSADYFEEKFREVDRRLGNIERALDVTK